MSAVKKAEFEKAGTILDRQWYCKLCMYAICILLLLLKKMAECGYDQWIISEAAVEINVKKIHNNISC